MKNFDDDEEFTMKMSLRVISRFKARTNRFLLAFLLLPMITVNVFAAEYNDIAGHWAEAIIKRATDLKLFQGTGNNQFLPQRDTTRAEFIAVMTRTLNPEVDGAENQYSYWATKYLIFAREKGYIPQDYDISEEYCSDTISRLEMIRLLALMIEKLQIPHDVTPPEMTDLGELDEDDLKTIDYVMTTGVIRGYNQKVMPYKTTSRAELATVILNMYDKSPLTSGSDGGSAPGSEMTSVSGDEVSGTSDAGYEVGDYFNDADAFASYKVNSQLTWKILQDPESKVFSFVVVNRENIVIAKSLSSLPASKSVSKFKDFPYIEYNYAGKTFWDYREWNDRVGEDGSIVIIEINPSFKREFDIAPQSEEEIKGFERVAEYITNVFRVKHGESVLKYHEDLHKFAADFSKKMDDGNFFSHDIPGGASFVDRARASGIQYKYIGENIAYGYPEPIHLVHAWINSPRHRDHMLDRFNRIGIGIRMSRFKGILATQDFIQSEE